MLGEQVEEVGADRRLRLDWERRYVEMEISFSVESEIARFPMKEKDEEVANLREKNDALENRLKEAEEGRERERERIENERREREEEEDAYEIRRPNRRDRRRMWRIFNETY